MSGGQVGGDPAARWLTSQRFAGLDQAARRTVEAQLAAIRDRVLDAAAVTAGRHVVDVGAGTGLLAAGALDRVGPAGTVTAVDLSLAALRLVRATPDGGSLHRVVGDAGRLPLADAVADAVVCRSVLVYLADVTAALREAGRVLRGGGRFAAFEPVNARRTHDATLDGMTRAELAAVARAQAAATPAARTMNAFDPKKTVVALALAGFGEVRLDLATARSTSTGVPAVEAMLRRPAHPGAPTLLETASAALGPLGARRYADAWRTAARRGPVTWTTPVAYLTGTRGTRPLA